MPSEKIQVTLVKKDVTSLEELPENARIILVVGGGRDGKTSLIHTFFNLYEKDIQRGDKDRFQLMETEESSSQPGAGGLRETKEIHAYSFTAYNEPNSRPLVFIDTPALDNSAAYTAIESYLKKQKRNIDAMLFVLKHSTHRIGPQEQLTLHFTNKLHDTFLKNGPVFIASTCFDNSPLDLKDFLCNQLKVDSENVFAFRNVPLEGDSKVADPLWEKFDCLLWESTETNTQRMAAAFNALARSSGLTGTADAPLDESGTNPIQPSQTSKEETGIPLEETIQQHDEPSHKNTSQPPSPNTEEDTKIVNKLRKLTEEYQSNLDKNKPVTKQINPILCELIKILNNKDSTDKAKIKGFYTYLDSKPLTEVAENSKSLQKNIDVIKQDKSISTKSFLTGIAVILMILATGIVPGLIVSGIVYAATGKSPVDFFNSKSKQYEKELNSVKRQPNLKGTLFEPRRSDSKDKEDEEPTLGIENK